MKKTNLDALVLSLSNISCSILSIFASFSYCFAGFQILKYLMQGSRTELALATSTYH